MSRRVIGGVLALSALVFVAGCGANGADTSVRSGREGDGSAVAAADGAVDAAGLRTVSYHGVEFEVPGAWPVYDLAADPSACVRFDVNAVYLGHPSNEMACPATLIGRTDAVLVEPNVFDTGSSAQVADPSAEVTEGAVNDLEAEVVDDTVASVELTADFPEAGVSATITYGDSDTLARQILASFRSAG